jgi:anti-anti-sigma factor
MPPGAAAWTIHVLGLAPGKYGDFPVDNQYIAVDITSDTVAVRFKRTVLDTQSAECIGDELSRLLPDLGERRLRLDLSNVQFVTAAVLGKIADLYSAIQTAGGGIVLANVQPAVYEIFGVARLTELLDIRLRQATSILIIEDDAAARDALKRILEHNGYTVACAADGQQALDWLRASKPPALILLDLMMQGMDGWQFRKEQVTDPALAEIPVVVVSSADDMPAGAAAYISKPVHVEQLLDAIRQHC